MKNDGCVGGKTRFLRSSRSAWQILLAPIFSLLVLHGTAFAQAPKVACASLAKLALPNATITLAKSVGAGAFQMPNVGSSGPGGALKVDVKSLPAFCRIAATLTPTRDSSIRIEVWLPANWNGKFLGLGNGGMAGSIVYAGGMALGLTDALRLGYATANTDAGHDSSQDKADGSFLLGHPEKQIDFGYRANHLMTVSAKAFIKAFYGVAPKYAMFIGCSLGSEEAMSEVKRYPEDYDGVIAGAAMNQIAPFNAAQIWPAVLIARDPAKALSSAKISAVHKAVLATCGTALDKQQGFLEDPTTCHFDPKAMLCKGEDNATCLTAPQAELARQIYQGPVNPRTGEVIFVGPPLGAEGQWGMVTGTNAASSWIALYRYGVLENPNWDWKTMDFDKDVSLANQKVGAYMHTDADLNAFFHHGGKLMLYIGWEDYHNPVDTIAYYNEIVKTAGPAIADLTRLFVVPGMGHCFGGDGCGSFDKVAAMDRWVATGKAPNEMLSTKVSGGKVVMSRPLCAYPAVAQYKGSGDINAAANFSCGTSNATNK